jgi:hypothetical protein
MLRHFVALSAVTIVLSAGPVAAATLTGSFSYDGQPVSEVLPGLTHGIAAAVNNDTSEIVFGAADPASGTYEIGDLTAGQWFVRVLLSDQEIGNRILVRGGEATGFDYAEVADETTVTLDLELRYAYRITQPFAGAWPGSVAECPYGAGLPAQFTFAWEPVPQAVRYEVAVSRVGCDGNQDVTSVETLETSVEILQGIGEGEDYIVIVVRAYSAGGVNLAARPYIEYDDGDAESALAHLAGEERPTHPMASLFVPQVARLPGVGDSFWTSDVVLTNPLSTEVEATLIYTERGANGLLDYLSETVVVPAGACRVLADVVGQVFRASGAGWLEVSPSSLGVASRISTPGQDGGSFGQGFPALTVDDAASLEGRVTVLGAGGVFRGTFRTNLILTEVWGEPAEVKVTVLDRDGAVVGTTDVSLPPFGTDQLNDLVSRVGGPATLSEGQVTVEVSSGEGRVVSVLSVVDQVTGDPTTLALEAR